MKLAMVLASSFVLLGCVQSPNKIVSYRNDALPSSEVIAFQAADARLKYQNARIEFDAKDCAFYQGIASDGKVRSTPLLNPQGQPICARSTR